MASAPFQPATNFWRAIELPVLAEALPDAGRGLDVGCGDGVVTRLLIELTGANWRLVGIDADPAETDLARRSGDYEIVHTTTADRVAEPDGSCDFAFSNSVLEHIGPLDATLVETARLLKSGGLFAATVPTDGFERLLRGPRRADRREAYVAETLRRLAVAHSISPGEWRRRFEAAGFEVVTARGYLTGRQLRRWETWTNWTGGLLYRVLGKRNRPIEIQRSFGMRRPLPRPLRPLAGIPAWAAGCGVLDDEPAGEDDASCLLIVGRRKG